MRTLPQPFRTATSFRHARLSLFSCGCLLATSLFATMAFGQAATVGIYFDPAYTQSDLVDPPLQEPIEFFVVISDVMNAKPGAGLAGYELALNIPPEITVTDRTMHPGSSINIGDGLEEWIVGTGECVASAGSGDILILTYTFFVMSDPGPHKILGFGPTDPTSFNPPAAGWLECENEMYPFAATRPGRINPVPCELAEATFAGTVVSALDSGATELWTVDVGKTVQGTLVNDLDGDGESNVLYWTASDGLEPGTVGQLDCFGGDVWSFTESGLTCQPTDGLVDVTAVEIGDFFDGNAGDEILVLARQNPANDVPVLRLDLLDVHGELLRGTSEFEYWVLGDMPAHQVVTDGPGQADLLVGGQENATGQALLIRLALDDLRGAGPEPASGCLSGLEEAIARWSYVPGEDNGGTEPYFQRESMITGLDVATTVSVTMESGNVYELDEMLAPLPCGLASIEVLGDDVNGLGGGGQVIWTVPAGAPILLAELLDVNGTAIVLVGVGHSDTANPDALSDRILTLECHGKTVDVHRGQVENCFGDTEPAELVDIQKLAPVAGNAEQIYARYLYPLADHTRLSTLELTEPAGNLNLRYDYDFPGEVTVGWFHQEAAVLYYLYAGLHDTIAGGFVRVLSFNALGIEGSAADGVQSCGPGNETWSALFDGSHLPLDDGEVVSITEFAADPQRWIEVTTTNGVYVLSKQYGTLRSDADCRIEHPDLDFNEVDVGESMAMSFRIINTGAIERLAGTVSPPCADFSIQGLASYDLGPWETQDFMVEFTPTQAGLQQCVIDPGSDLCVDIVATGTGIIETCRVEPATLEFGTVEVGDFETLEFTITNVGADPLVGEVTSPVAWLTITGDATYDLASDEGQTFEMTFTPTSGVPFENEIDTGAAVCTNVWATGAGVVFGEPELRVGTEPAGVAGSEATLIVDGSDLAGVATFTGTIVFLPDVLTITDVGVGSLIESAGGFGAEFDEPTPGALAFTLQRDTGLKPLAEESGDLLELTFLIDRDVVLSFYGVQFAELTLLDQNGDPLPVPGSPQAGGINVFCLLFDVSGDGAVHSNDAILALRIDVGLTTGTARQICAADADRDGHVTAGDAVAILRAVVDLPAAEPVARPGQGTLVVDGDMRSLPDGSLEIPLAVEADVDVAGVDLSFALVDASGTMIPTEITPVDDSALVVSNVHRTRTDVAIASARGLGPDGARFILRVRSELVREDMELRILDARAFALDGGALDLDFDDSYSVSGDQVQPAPKQTVLWQNNPNPFNPRTEIRFHLVRPGPIDLSVYDVAGRRVRTLVAGHREAGEHSVVWQGRDDDGQSVASGVYIYRLVAPGSSTSKRMILVR